MIIKKKLSIQVSRWEFAELKKLFENFVWSEHI